MVIWLTAPRTKRLTAQRMYEVYLATRGVDAPVEEILRKYGLDFADLEAIEEAIEAGEGEVVAGRKGKSRHDDGLSDDDYAHRKVKLRH